jgi:PHD/YefM family antitoxin component YafN of YafNO toxin-antitoxin module
MLPTAMPTIPITDLRTRQPEVIDTIKQSPVLLTRQGHGAGVLVHPDMWNQLVAELERYKRHRRERLQRIRTEMAAGNEITQEELETELQKRGML